MARIFFIVVCLIIYGSLYPWQFQSTHFVASPVTMLLHSWPASFNRYVLRDTGVNILLYVPLGIFGYLLFLPRLRKAGAVVVVLVSAVAVSTAVEIGQLYEPSRYASIFDIACNLTGAAAGLIVAAVYTESLMPLIAWTQQGEFLHLTAGAVLLLCWVGYQTVPIFPQLSTTQLLLKLRSLGSRASWSLVELAASFVDWLAVAAVVEDVAGSNGAPLALTVVILLLPGRLFLDGRSLAGAECVGALLALVVWRHSFSTRPDRYLTIAWLSLAALILRGLAPFHVGPPQQFSWIPFAASLSYDQAAALVVFLKKCFLYGAAVWLLRKAGYSYWPSTLVVAALLGAIEAVQIRLPGRTPEITDPLLAVIMAVILYFTSRHMKTREAASKIAP